MERMKCVLCRREGGGFLTAPLGSDCTSILLIGKGTRAHVRRKHHLPPSLPKEPRRGKTKTSAVWPEAPPRARADPSPPPPRLSFSSRHESTQIHSARAPIRFPLSPSLRFCPPLSSPSPPPSPTSLARSKNEFAASFPEPSSSWSSSCASRRRWTLRGASPFFFDFN